MIGVCIKYFHENYGGMLQAYATISMMEKRKINYELIRYEKKRTSIEIIRSIPRFLNSVLLKDKYEQYLKEQGKRKHPDLLKNDAMRLECFREFSEEHFTKLSPVFQGYDQLCAGAERYTAVMTGSDQLWSPAGLPTNYYNLMFVPDSIRKISYASSFGVKQIPWYQRGRTRKFLERIEYISVRENRGSEIVQELTNRDVPTILDPVFMFNRKEWERLIPVNNEIDEPYIFAYFLGSNPMHRNVVKKAASELNCKIVAMRHMDQYVPADEEFGDMAPYDVGPDRFLNLLRGASYVCTDSFHGACFSLIHGKQFVIFDRYSKTDRCSKNSRIDTLCNQLGVNNRRFCVTGNLAEQLNARIEYCGVNKRIDLLRKEADQYLKEALRGIS